jgi:hypothetical protein
MFKSFSLICYMFCNNCSETKRSINVTNWIQLVWNIPLTELQFETSFCWDVRLKETVVVVQCSMGGKFEKFGSMSSVYCFICQVKSGQFTAFVQAVLCVRSGTNLDTFQQGVFRKEENWSVLFFWVVTPCGIVNRYQRSGQSFCLYVQG